LQALDESVIGREVGGVIGQCKRSLKSTIALFLMCHVFMNMRCIHLTVHMYNARAREGLMYCADKSPVVLLTVGR